MQSFFLTQYCVIFDAALIIKKNDAVHCVIFLCDIYMMALCLRETLDTPNRFGEASEVRHLWGVSFSIMSFLDRIGRVNSAEVVLWSVIFDCVICGSVNFWMRLLLVRHFRVR